MSFGLDLSTVMEHKPGSVIVTTTWNNKTITAKYNSKHDAYENNEPVFVSISVNKQGNTCNMCFLKASNGNYIQIKPFTISENGIINEFSYDELSELIELDISLVSRLKQTIKDNHPDEPDIPASLRARSIDEIFTFTDIMHKKNNHSPKRKRPGSKRKGKDNDDDRQK